jgi:acetoin utilization deacetylase AcuC-like enzyme
MSLAVITHQACLKHCPPAGHPERPARLEAALRGVEQIRGHSIVTAHPVRRRQLLRAHTAAYLDRLDDLDASGGDCPLDPDTHLGRDSLTAAALAAGAVCQGVDRVMATTGQRAFAVVRPPGHHAEADRAMGFCLYSSLAVGALHAADEHGLKRVCVVDFDVHHGNGSEAILGGREGLLFVGSHQSPLYPGTGCSDSDAAANVVNALLSPHSGSDEFREHWLEHLLPRIDLFKPDIVLVSAGFDAHWRDPLAQLQLKDEDFFWIGERLVELADRHASGRLVASLEGGYDLTALEDSVLAFGEALE